MTNNLPIGFIVVKSRCFQAMDKQLVSSKLNESTAMGKKNLSHRQPTRELFTKDDEAHGGGLQTPPD